MNLELLKIIEQCNSKRSNIYYKLNQLESITGLSTRMLKYRMKAIKQKYINIPSLLCKIGKSWQIHISIVNEFLPIRNNKNRQPIEKWQSFCTWNTKNSYTVDYHLVLINEIKESISPAIIQFAIEEDKRKVNHVHIIATIGEIELNKAVQTILGKYIEQSQYRIQISSINNKYSAVQYIAKAPLANGVI